MMTQTFFLNAKIAFISVYLSPEIKYKKDHTNRLYFYTIIRAVWYAAML